jgi:hypothetical protein
MTKTLDRIDLRKQFKQIYTATATAAVVDLPPMSYLMVDGQGDPNTSPEYVAAVGALYSVSFTLKFTFKRGPERIDYSVMPLEGLWWADDMASFASGDRAKWRWTAMIMQPEFITATHVDAAVTAVKQKRPNEMLGKLRLERFVEGRAAQLLHIGPYSTEASDIERLHAFIAAQGAKLSGRHHEIYLSDPRRVAPERLKTIIRQPFAV